MSLQTMAHFLKLKFSWLLPKCPCEADNFYLHTPLLQIFFCTPPRPPNQPPLSQLSHFSSVQSLSRGWLSMPWTAACQASLSNTNSQSPHKPTSIGQWCHPTISFSVISFSSCPQDFPASGSFQMSQLFVSGGQSIGVSASTSVFQWTTGLISFRMDWLDLLAVQGTLKNLL